MNWPAIYHWVRYWSIVVGLSQVSGIFWGMVGAGLARWLFDLEEETAMLWVFLPIYIALLPYCIFILPKDLKKAGIL